MSIYYSPSFKGFYDTRVGYSQYPDDVIDVTDQYAYLIDQINNYNREITVVDSQIVVVDRPVSITIPTWDEIISLRNKLLLESDFTQLPDVNLPNKQEWASYRQLLRDISQTYREPSTVVWPTPP
jgi:hypothetical protein